LEQGRQINAVVALGGIGLGLLLALLAVATWLRHGRDPVYIDDNSVLLAAPPPDLTPAMATLLLNDRTSDRTVTAGLVDLAVRGCIAFQADLGPLGETSQTGIRYLGAGAGTVPPLEAALRDDIMNKSKKHDNLMTPKILYRLIGSFDEFKDGLETLAVKRGWLNAKPSSVMMTWGLIAGLEFSAAIVVAILWLIIQASGLFTLTVGLVVAGAVTTALTRHMPARTRQGAMLWAMLSAYQRTLKLTLAQAHSMGDVVSAKALPWITTPDQAMAWGVAFGLDNEIEIVLSRSLAEAEEPTELDADGKIQLRPERVVGWQPSWYSTGSFMPGHSGGSGPSMSISGGLFSAAAIPDFSSIVSVIGSINHPTLPMTSSSSSSSSSSFSSGGFGGGGGGGGGGAGGGF
jgi:hypothetical protein